MIRGSGILGLFSIAAMVGISYSLGWNVPWLYVAGATLIYGIGVMTTNQSKEEESATDWSPHLAYLFWALALLIHSDGVLSTLMIFTAAGVLGAIIPFIIYRK